MGKASKHQRAIDDAAAAAAKLQRVTQPTGHAIQPDSGVERDLRELEVARDTAYGEKK